MDKQINNTVIFNNCTCEENNYNEQETLTGKKWRDGKPIYRKVAVITDFSSIVGNNFVISSYFSDVEQIVALPLIINDSVASSDNISFNSDNSFNTLTIFHMPLDNDIIIRCNGEGTVLNLNNVTSLTVILEYTKKTD